MPYISSGRERLQRDPWSASNPAELSYVITKLLTRYIDDMTLCFATINECIGVLECAKLELYRRIAAPYENKKMGQNGDVYPYTIIEGGQIIKTPNGAMRILDTDPDVEDAARMVEIMRSREGKFNE